MYGDILVPTDGSDHAERAMRHASSLAEAFDATVHLLAVADVTGAAGPFDAGGVSREFADQVSSLAEQAVESAREAAGDVPVETAVVEGDPPAEILAYAEEESVDLVAMGTHGRSGLRRLVAGSVTEHVVRRASVPVVTVREADVEAVTDYDDVLVPTDGSGPAAAALDHAIAVAAAYDATIHAVNVVDVGALAAGSDVTPATRLLEQLKERGEDATGDIADRAREADVNAVTAVREGFPGPDLLEYVEESGIDFVTMGTHGRTGIDRLLVGSTTERLIRRADVPVMSVRPPEA
jgi:nucleotide-binding universal stress UspA family protein